MAWLSASGETPSSRLFHSPVRYVRVDGVKIADDWADLVDGSLDNPISVDESGNPVSSEVWTDTNSSGGTTNQLSDCEDWTSSSAQSSPGGVGLSTVTNDDWTAVYTKVCNAQLRLYCFEQPLSPPPAVP